MFTPAVLGSGAGGSARAPEPRVLRAPARESRVCPRASSCQQCRVPRLRSGRAPRVFQGIAGQPGSSSGEGGPARAPEPLLSAAPQL
eukprot:1110505-Alexandrium_andersonii.AAC.1